jgi:hypothetical protein
MKRPCYANERDCDSEFLIANSFPKSKINFCHTRGAAITRKVREIHSRKNASQEKIN